MRTAGISRQKAGYLKDLCEKVSSGAVPLDALEAMTDEEVIAALTQVKGIGRWSAEMFLIFRLQRPDVLPLGDLGILNAIQKAYRLRKKPTAARMSKLGEAWKPYRSVASWYLWRSLEPVAPGHTSDRISQGESITMSRSRAPIVLALLLLLAPAHAQQKPADKWDVAADYGPTSKLAFDTSEGTWMNLDVSPDGTRIVFDLLGDIYTMPIGGSGSSPATRIAGGAVFDMQPRFSPDGKRIAFASDRDGLWNIWTMDVDGKNAKQISREKRWFINSPTWSPDGEYIYARRHFVAQRSLGAGEIWMYHSSGSVRRPAGDRARRLAEGQRRAGHLARRPLPVLQQGRHARG